MIPELIRSSIRNNQRLQEHPLCELHLTEGLKGEKTENHTKNFRKLVAVMILCCIMMTVELVGGYLANSLAIMTDAAHLFRSVHPAHLFCFTPTRAKLNAFSSTLYGYSQNKRQ